MTPGGRNRSGQISVLMVLSLFPIMALFAFAVNIGMLVNAKISLQNAADLAAYAGAATQARQLTHISHLNYQMRQAYKKFLFKYYVIGNMSLRCFPRPGGPHRVCTDFQGTEPQDGQKFDFINPGGGAVKFPGAPAVCISLAPESNPCQLGEAVPLVKIPECFPLDPICGTLRASTESIKEIQKKSCEANSLVNLELLMMWLYATDDTGEFAQVKQANLRGLIQEVGLVIENQLHFERIQTIQKAYINRPAEKNVTESSIFALERVPDQATTERTVLAFRTAATNLNHNVFSDIQMSELMPQNMLQLKKIEPEFTALAVNMVSTGDRCQLQIQEQKAQPILGVVKDSISERDSDIFYAVKLTARAKLLFNPFPFGHPSDSIELTAYAAAAPFGSRIGPDVKEAEVVEQMNAAGGAKPIPKIRMGYNGEEITDAKILRAYYGVLHADGAGTAGVLQTEDFRRAIQASQVPDQYEVGKYNIPVDTDFTHRGDERFEFVPYFHRGAREYTFWAPLFSPGNGSLADLTDQLKQIILDKIAGSTTKGDARSDMAGTLISSLEKQLTKMRNTNNFNVARMANPLASGSPVAFKETDTATLASSYVTDHDRAYLNSGRDGYSVKLIPLRKIVSKVSDRFAQQEIANISH